MSTPIPNSLSFAELRLREQNYYRNAINDLFTVDSRISEDRIRYNPESRVFLVKGAMPSGPQAEISCVPGDSYVSVRDEFDGKIVRSAEFVPSAMSFFQKVWDYVCE